ncbi:hypothetical protein [Butyrivibrio proteoclasticus]|uniref:hypothetical protein n=1 Tax=Butyrivibrio proteoclasticus TaxID=43305 RepID=UPI00047C8BF6|nr:hypothetical protein [Butyrivibrio proteoclasticus]
MSENSKKDWYNKKVTAERLYELKTDYEEEIGHRMSGLQLVKQIKEKTGIDIGGNTYNKHESPSNKTNMSIELLYALSKFYGVSYDYILGFSDTKYPEREDITEKYGLTDRSLTNLENIKRIRNMQEKDDPGVPTDLDVINALFESTEFQSLVDLIRVSRASRDRAAGTNYYDSRNARGNFIDSLSKKQAETAKEGALSVLAAYDTKEYIDYKIQRTISNLVNEILDNL